ncbi:hypothetical protein V5F77_20450 [Xanthobacter sp. DSM 24535]|uniref:hypothetical protein n=1 Tax=Roseixanthobacter psychrophilus TaxID=3119917 RepID=UPI00372C15A6
MPWVKFTADFDWRPQIGKVHAFTDGTVALVTTPCAAAAKAAGAAEPAAKPKDASEPDLAADDLGG